MTSSHATSARQFAIFSGGSQGNVAGYGGGLSSIGSSRSAVSGFGSLVPEGFEGGGDLGLSGHRPPVPGVGEHLEPRAGARRQPFTEVGGDVRIVGAPEHE